MPTPARSLFDPAIVRRAIIDALLKLDPRHQVKNPVMFVVEVGSVLTTLLLLQALVGYGEAPAGFILAIALWLWLKRVSLSPAMARRSRALPRSTRAPLLGRAPRSSARAVGTGVR